MEEVARRCTMCKGDGEWRLQLRNCGHIVCASCGLRYLQKWVKLGIARIKCPKRGCTARIHPNDVDALFDDDNRMLRQHITEQRLKWFREENAKNIVTFALGGKSHVQRCPNCLNIYGQRFGCNYVKCPIKSCKTKFCWTCGKKQTSWQHFGTSETCRVSWDDIWQSMWLFRFVLTANPCFLFCISPIVWLFLFICVPVYLCLSFPYYMGNRWWRCMREKNWDENVMIAIIALTTPLFLMVGVLLALLSIFWLLGLWYAFAAFTLCKCIPVVSRAFDLIDLIQCFAGIAGFGQWKKIIRDTKEQREQFLINRRYTDVERSERLF